MSYKLYPIPEGLTGSTTPELRGGTPGDPDQPEIVAHFALPIPGL